MRQDPTSAEKLLWQKLRHHQIGGLKFRRQMPLGPCIVDFCCPSARLVIELDGVSHFGFVIDAARDAWMQAQGIRILRFSNYEVFRNLEGVLLAIGEAAGTTPPPNLDPLRGSSPQGEGESLTPSPPVTPSPPFTPPDHPHV
jgi:BirA family biotin operon repressor/biotin-[acetyl-CoA-carboxylase] ligase